jgi:hypothetical protein
MARIVIQIGADPSYLYVLCNDGEIFRLVNHVWQAMPPIPQDDPRDRVEAETWIFSDRG